MVATQTCKASWIRFRMSEPEYPLVRATIFAMSLCGKSALTLQLVPSCLSSMLSLAASQGKGMYICLGILRLAASSSSYT